MASNTMADAITLNVLVGDKAYKQTVSLTATIGQLRRLLADGCLSDVIGARGRPGGAGGARAMRLIHAGRLLSDDNASLTSLRIADGASIHVVLPDPRFSASVAAEDPPQAHRSTFAALGWPHAAAAGVQPQDARSNAAPTDMNRSSARAAAAAAALARFAQAQGLRNAAPPAPQQQPPSAGLGSEASAPSLTQTHPLAGRGPSSNLHVDSASSFTQPTAGFTPRHAGPVARADGSRAHTPADDTRAADAPESHRLPGGAAATTDAARVMDEDAAARAPRGFERLRMLGLDDDDVAALRAMYLPLVLARMPAIVQRRADEPHDVYVHRMEEAWMLQQDENSEFIANLRPRLAARGITLGDGEMHGGRRFAGNRDELEHLDYRQEDAGTIASFLFGFLLGFTLGILSVFILVCSRSTREGGWLTRKARWGLLTGIGVNAGLSLYLNDGTDGSAGRGGGSGGGGSSSGGGGGSGYRSFDFLDLLDNRSGYAPPVVGSLPAGRRLRGVGGR